MVDQQGLVISLIKVPVGTIFAKNTPFFAPALTTKFNDKSDTWYVMKLAFDTSAVLQFTVDNGTTWLAFDNGTGVFPQNFTIPRSIGEQFNLRCTDAGGCTVRICNISESGGS